MNVLVAIVGLGLLVLVHESGHFFTALAVGMRPRRFYIGFPPPLARIRHRGIEYGIGSIPLGGYVKIPGMHRPAPSDLDVRFGAALAEEPRLLAPLEAAKRGLPLEDAAPLAELGSAVAAARLSPRARKSAERSVSDVGDALAPDAYWRAPTWKRIGVILAGPGANVLFAIVLLTILFVFGSGRVTSMVDVVLPDHPAAQAGLRHGDRIIGVDGRKATRAQISTLISSSKGRPLTLLVRRDGRMLSIGPLRARKSGGRYLIGVRWRAVGLPLPSAAWQAVKDVGYVTKATVVSVANLVHKKDRKQISSAVGIVQGSSTALSQGVQDYLFVLAFISLSLALLNLLPLLPLDGGHIAFSLVEGIRRRPVARDVYERVSVVGIALVLMLFFVGLSNDVGRLGGG